MSNYKVDKNRIIIENKYFDAIATLYSGQVFRVKKLSPNKFLVSSCDKACIVTIFDNETEIIAEDVNYFINYFDLDTDYTKILLPINHPYIEQCLLHSGKLKILKQEPFETIIDFIMSANNNIKRFSKTLEKIAQYYGEKKEFLGYTYYTFPTPSILSNASVDKLKKFGVGYRDKYIVETSKEINNGFDLSCIDKLDTISANKHLCKLLGVGEKVADCILLFAFRKLDAFPVDTWIEKVYRENFFGEQLNRKKIREFFVNTFGKYAGVYQQYLFYYKRGNGKQ